MQCKSKKCQKEIDNDSLFCKWCGAAQKKSPNKKLYQRPDGLYEKAVTINGKRVVFRAKSEAEIYRKIAEHEDKVEKGALFEEISKRWEDTHFKTLTENAKKPYKPALRRVNEHFTGWYIKDIKPKDIQAFINDFAQQGYADKTTRTQLMILNLIFSKAVLDSEIEINPVEYVKIPRNLPKSERKLPTDEQLDIVKNGLSLPYGFIPFFLLYTGCRIGEAMAVQFKDIDHKNKLIHITKSAYHIGETPHIKQPKTQSGIRDIILLDKLLAILPDGKAEDYVLSGRNDPLGNYEFRIMWEKYCLAADMYIDSKDKSGKKYTQLTLSPHQLRHAYCTILFEAGIDEKDAQQLMGHASIAMTRDIYTHIRQRRMNETATKLNEYENTQNTQ